jgi:hypothetical protein
MKRNSSKYTPLVCVFSTLILVQNLFCPAPALADYSLLKKIIVPYNMNALKESLINESYRGEEGILRIRPEVGKALGMKVFIDQDYLDSSDLYQKADTFLEKAKASMASEEKESLKDEHVKEIADYFLTHKRSTELAKRKLVAYRSRLSLDLDDRLDEDLSMAVMDRLLKGSFEKTDNRLRDALGWFYNVCQGEHGNGSPLTPENVSFVNYVFYRFTTEGSKKALNGFDLDRDDTRRPKESLSDWKNAVSDNGAQYIPLLEQALKKFGNKIYRIDPLLFLALVRRESSFDPLAISPVGAVGLTQIMPKTGKGLGMKNIYMPEYLGKAASLMRRERRAKEGAIAALLQISETNKMDYARKARQLMQQSLRLGRQRERLFARYKKELLQNRSDDRLQPSKAIEYGLRYFARMMRDQGGDMSLALAAYNAGPHRVKTFKGIPPFEETVYFRNRVLEYYRGYLRRTKDEQ